MKYLIPIDMGGNHIANLRLEGLASDPTALGNAHIYYNTSTHKVRVRMNGAWGDLGAGEVIDWGDLTGRPAHLTGTANTANQVIVADAGGKVPAANIPNIAITEYLGAVASQSAMLALTGQLGDWCIRTDLSKVFVITGADPSLLAGWTSLEYPIPDDPEWDDVQNKPSTFAPRKHSATIGDNTNTSITVTHGFGTRDVLVEVRELAGDQETVLCNVRRTSDNAVQLVFAVAPATNALRVVVTG
jgi:hypothetical protein